MLCAVMKVTQYMRTGGGDGVTRIVEFDVRKDGSVMASVGETLEFSVLSEKLANLGREPKCSGSPNGYQRRNDSCVEWRWPPKKAPQQ